MPLNVRLPYVFVNFAVMQDYCLFCHLKKGNWVVRFLSLTAFFTAKCDQTVLSSNSFTTVHVSQENANNAVK